MKRKIYEDLKIWKNKKNRKPLVLQGARQVGKTWIIKEFAKNEFSSFVYINCDSNETISELFQHDFDIKRILRGISAVSGATIMPGETLIFFDEIQEVPRAIQSLKYFCEDANEYHVIVAGSLLGIHEHKGISFPVGKIQTLYMYPLSFSEFILALAGQNMYEILMTADLEELNGMHSAFVEYLRQYYFTGGMPEAVQEYADSGSLENVRAIQKQILSDYNNDISKHAPKDKLMRTDQVWKSVPAQLSKENKKFVYANIQKGGRAKEFEIAIQWLCNCGLVHKVNRVSKGILPLRFYEDFSVFKLYMLDCGLMGAITDTPASQILIGENIFREYKGAFTENFVLQQLLVHRQESIYYFSPSDSKQEIDFIIQKGEDIIPIEVKAEENLRAKSLKQFCLDNDNHNAVRLSMLPYKEQDWMKNIPLYAAERLWDFE